MDASEIPAAALRRTPVRFAEFEFDPDGLVLRRQGTTVPLPSQSAALLGLLLSTPGAVVSRESIRAAIWPGVTVDFDTSTNTVVRNLRRALRDDAHEPRFIETVQRRGYRFKGAVTAASEDSAATSPAGAAPAVRRAGRWRWRVIGAAAVLLVLVATASFWRQAGRPAPAPPRLIDFRTLAKDVPSLERAGLRVLHQDPTTWAGGAPGEPLRLATARGDFWRKVTDPELPPRNVIVWPQSSPWFRATLKIGSFRPGSDWQQAGLVITDDDAFANYVRLTWAWSAEAPHGKIQMVAQRSGEDVLYTQELVLPAPPQEMSLRIIRQGDRFLFEYRPGPDHRDWRVLDFRLDPVRFRLGQASVAIAAFQGVSHADDRPLDQTPAIAAIEFLEIQPLSARAAR